MTDIVERLHEVYHTVCQMEDGDYLPARMVETMIDAKDEIERLRAALRRICEPLTVTGDSDSSSACRDLHELICAIAQAALRRKA